MEELGMTRDEFAARISTSRRTLDKWLLQPDSVDYRELSEMGRSYVEEILEWHKKSI